MPTYEYICLACGEPTEHFASMSAPALKKCPHCGKNKLERQIGTGAGFIFKGGGFYETDYRSEGYKKAAKEDAPPSEKKAEKAGGSDKPDKAEKPASGGESKKPEAKKPETPKAPAADKPKPGKKD